MTKVVLSKIAQKRLEHLPKSEQEKVKKRMMALRENPLAGKKLSGKLTDYRSVRAWPYKIIYFINEKINRVEIVDVTHRQGAYR